VPSKLREDEPDGTRSKDDDLIAEVDSHSLDSIDGARNGLDERGFVCRHVPNVVCVRGRDEDAVGKPAIACDADRVEREAMVVPLTAAIVAGAAIDVWIDRDPASNTEAANIGANGDDRSRELVSGNEWIPRRILALEDVNVRPTHSRPLDVENEVVGSGLGFGDLSDREAFARFEYCCFHRIPSRVRCGCLYTSRIATTQCSHPWSEVRPRAEGSAMSEETHAQRIVVNVDAELEDLVPGFLENRRSDVGKMRTALSTGEFDAIRVLGHSMKGSGGGYGFNAITDIGRRIEDAAKVRDSDSIVRAIDELSDYLERVDVVYVW
jgi:HPt (histidine-containing phosphotransfer) domain-containing protein